MFTCSEVGSPMNSKFTQEFTVEIGGSKIDWINPKGEKTKMQCFWQDNILVYFTDEEYPKIVQHYMEDETLIVKVSCRSPDGHPMKGNLKHTYHRAS